MTVRVGINGFGRVGRCFFRIARERDVEVVAINDVTDTATLAHLLAHDSTFGRLDAAVEAEPGALVVDGRRIAVTAERDPALLDWGALGGVTSSWSRRAVPHAGPGGAAPQGGARKVLVSAPGKDLDVTDRARCQRRRLRPGPARRPLQRVLHDQLRRPDGQGPRRRVRRSSEVLMTTIHAYTNDQVTLDSPHKDLRRGRTAAVNIIPTSTGAARAAAWSCRRWRGGSTVLAVRVPVEDGR
jgi:glyceraldehyde 3-phosphate dehydrogenase